MQTVEISQELPEAVERDLLRKLRRMPKGASSVGGAAGHMAGHGKVGRCSRLHRWLSRGGQDPDNANARALRDRSDRGGIVERLGLPARGPQASRRALWAGVADRIQHVADFGGGLIRRDA